MQVIAEDDCLIIRPFYTNIYIYNTMYLQSMMNRKQSLRDHPLKTRQQTDRGTPHREA